MDARFEGKTVLITGGASGLGLATAERIVSEGGAVALADRDLGQAQAEAARLGEGGGRAEAFEVDVTDFAALERTAAAAKDAFGSIDGLFANAGIDAPGDTLETTLEEWDRVIDIDLKGVWLSIKAVLPVMLEQGAGAIVTTASVAGITGLPGVASYSAAKAGVVGMTRQIACDYGRSGVRANSICPGTVLTPLSKKTYTTRAGGDPGGGDELLEQRAQQILLGKLGEPDDVGSIVTFLLSDEAKWLTGGTYLVDGGMTAGTPGARTPIM